MSRIKYDGKEDVTVTGRGLILSAAALLTAGAVVFGGWQLGWWFKSHNVDRAAQVNRQSLGFQEARLDEITRKSADLKTLKVTASTTQDESEKAQLNAQSQALTSIICADYVQLTPSYRATLDPTTVADLTSLCG